MLTPVSIRESDDPEQSGDQHVSTVTATLDHASSAAATVTVSARAALPGKEEDFLLSANRTLTVAAGATTSSGTVTLSAVDNTVDAPNKTVTVSATAANGQGITAPQEQTLTITDDDEPSTTVALAVAPDEVNEDAGAAVTLTVTGTLNAGTRTTATVVTLAVSAGTAAADDYSATGATLTIAAEQSSGSASLTVTPVDDAVDEPNETVVVSGTVGGLDVTGAEVSIIDNEDTPALTLVMADSIYEYETSVSVRMRLSGASSEDTVATVFVSPVPPAVEADFSLSTNRTLSIAAGSTTSSRPSVVISMVDNDVLEPSRELTVSAMAANSQGVTGPPARTLTILDDDSTPKWTLTVTPSPILEFDDPDRDGDEHVGTITATLNRASNERVRITILASPIAPALGSDFILENSVLTIAAGETASTAATITAVNNDVVAPDKRVQIVLILSEGSVLPSTEEDAFKTLTILDDDYVPPKVTLVLTPASIRESDDPETFTSEHMSIVTATLDRVFGVATTVTVAAAPVAPALAADYTLSTNRTLSIAAGATTSTGTVTLSAVDNTAGAPDKTVTVSATAANRRRITAPQEQTLTITDDEETSTSVMLAVTPDEVNEDGGAQTLIVIGTLNAAPRTEDTVVTLAVTDYSGGYVGGYDYTATTLTIAAGQSSGSASLTVTPVDDTVVEEGRKLAIYSYYGNTNGLVVEPVRFWIVDDDRGLLSLSLSNVDLIFDSDGNKTVAVSGAGASSVTVTAMAHSDQARVLIVSNGCGNNAEGQKKIIPLAAGRNTITITVTEAFGLVTVYELEVERLQPMARWPMDNNANDVVRGLHGVLSGGVGFTNRARVGSAALNLDGTDDYIRLSEHVASFPLGDSARSVAGWFSHQGSIGDVTNQSFFSYGNRSSHGGAFGITAHRLEVSVGVSGHRWGVNGLNLSAGWHHVAVTYEAGGKSDTIRIYVDGAEQTAATLSGGRQTMDTQVGNAFVGRNIGSGNFHRGKIDDLHLYDYALSAQEVERLARMGGGSGPLAVPSAKKMVWRSPRMGSGSGSPVVPSAKMVWRSPRMGSGSGSLVTFAEGIDYDTDDDGLIEVINLAQLNVIRHDLDGNGEADSSSNDTDYETAFPDAGIGMGCPGSGCTGYELMADLDFAGTDWSRGSGWEPIGTEPNKFTATFHGNGHTISKLFINRASTEYAGLFGYSTGVIRNLGLERVNVHGGRLTGGLVGRTDGEVSASYVTGQVAAASGSTSGGLAGFNAGTIRTSYARASVGVGISRRAGGLVGENDTDGAVLASYAAGSANATAQAGGLAAWNKGPVKISYSVSRVWDNGDIAGGFFGGQSSPPSGVTYNGNYWQTRAGLATADLGFTESAPNVANQISAKTATELQSPVSKTSGIYQTWDDEDVTGDNAADDPWDLGTSAQYPVLQVDFNGDGSASWEEFGEQRRGEALAADWEADHTSNNAVSDTWIDFLWAREDGRQAVLPDFSYAGYKYSQEEVPDVTHQRFDVTNYGAVANDNRSDQSAIQAAIDAAEANGSGIVFFPAGEFLVNTDEDLIANPVTETNSSITVQSSNIVLRGSGSREGGTIIRQVNDMPAITPGDKWTPPYMFLFRGPGWSDESIDLGEELTTISGDAPRGTFWIEVADAAQLRVGQRIVLYMAGDTGAVSEFLAPYSVHGDWGSLRNTGIRMLERHSIAEIRGNRVRLNEPLRALKIRSSYDLQVMASLPLIEEVGVEDISFQGSYLENFVHHESARGNSGWSLLRMRGCVNCWMRRVSFVNVNRALEVGDSAAVSVYQVTIKGNRAHFGYRNRKNYGAWFGLVEDLANQQHGMNTMSHTTGSVHWRNDQAEHQRTDVHAGGPYANLIDCMNGGRLSSTSGHHNNFPSHHRHLVFWNFKHDHSGSSSYHYDLWTRTKWGEITLVKPIIVGSHGEPVTFSSREYEVLESNGSAVSPECLFEAQLETRLGSVPAWLDGLRTEWAALRATSLPVPTVLARSGIDDLALEMGSSHTVDVEDNFEVLHNRSISSRSVASSSTAVATVSRSGWDVRITPVAAGSTTITVTAASSAGDTATQKFEVTVTSSNARTQANQRKNAGSGSNLRTSTPATTELLAKDAKLSALRLSGVNFGAFDSAVTNYSAAVAHDIPAIEVVAAPADAGASVVIEDANGGTAGRRRTVALAEGENTISITVTAGDGRTTRTYRVIVTRGPEEWVRDARSFELDRNNTAPAGLWSDRNTLWVADWKERKLFAYGLPEGERLPERDIAVEGAPMGLWSDGETIWVVNHHGGLQAYRLADGGRVPGRGLELADSAAPVGLWSDGETAWVSEWLGRTVKAYLLADGRRVPSRDMVVDDAVETLLAAGVWADGLTLWLADWSVDQVRALGMSDGRLEAGRSVATAAAGYADPTGLWSDGATLWVTAWNGERVHVHALPRAPAAGAGPMLRPAASAFARGAGRLAGENRKLDPGHAAADSIAAKALRVNGGEPPASGQAGAGIADPILRGRILAALGKAAEQPLGAADMAELKVLNLRHAGVADLSGLEHAINLEELDLGLNPLADVSPLAALPALASLDLDGVSLANLAPLSSLTGLGRLSLRNNAIVELAPLAQLSRLTRLDLGGNQVANLYPLSGLTELTELWADGNRVSDLSALAPLTRLTQLDLSDNRIRYLHALSGMRRLETLNLAGNELSQLYPLSGLAGLRTLVLRGNAIEELQPLSHLGELQSLDVHGNRISGLHPLSGLRSLVWLDICHNPIEDFSPAYGLSASIILGNAEQHQGISN